MQKLMVVQLSFKCPKAFNELIPCNGGWYCNGCHKVVHDFRGKQEKEIAAVFNQHNQNMCGLFEADRILVNSHTPKWRKWLSAVVIAMGFTGLYHKTYAQNNEITVNIE